MSSGLLVPGPAAAFQKWEAEDWGPFPARVLDETTFSVGLGCLEGRMQVILLAMMLAAENGPQPVLFASTDFASGTEPNPSLQP